MYLQQCVESILAQTYTDFELILVDDGSTDESGLIAESFDDPRIKVIHTSNQGLSAARNLGINCSKGDFISFVDADDWIEEDVFSVAISEIGDSDILCFGYNDRVYKSKEYQGGKDALEAFIQDRIPGTAWCMLCKKSCFLDIRFPVGRIHEDTATTYKLFYLSHKVKCICKSGYNYRYRKESISHVINLKNLIDFWLAHEERFFYCNNLVSEEAKLILLKYCAFAITRAWQYKNFNTKEIPFEYSSMSSFAKNYFPTLVWKQLPLGLRFGVILAHFNNPLSFWVANKSLAFTRICKNSLKTCLPRCIQDEVVSIYRRRQLFSNYVQR